MLDLNGLFNNSPLQTATISRPGRLVRQEIWPHVEAVCIQIYSTWHVNSSNGGVFLSSAYVSSFIY